ncbi:hypothetical protein Q1695_015134 [Nippostrongylus brasiliensis]|nr:hypothetical protein Q1695_015134 [Nippostrongylus brasiliensis]
MSNTQSGGCEVNCGAELVDAFLGAMMRMLTQPVAGAEQGANEQNKARMEQNKARMEQNKARMEQNKARMF